MNDIQGAREAGLSTFWLTDQDQELASNHAGAGKLEDLLPWIDFFAADRLPPNFHSPSACTATLLATPAVLDGVLEKLPDRSWTYKPDPNEWSLNEIIYHLRDVDQEVNLPRLEMILSENNPFIAGADTDPWAQERNYFHQDGFVALHQFIASRTRLVERIQGIQPPLWHRPARHSIFGPTDFLEVAWLITRHDRLHVSQVLHTLRAIPAENKS